MMKTWIIYKKEIVLGIFHMTNFSNPKHCGLYLTNVVSIDVVSIDIFVNNSGKFPEHWILELLIQTP